MLIEIARCDSKPCSLEKLKTEIRDQIEEIDEGTLERVEANYRELLQTCVGKNERHLNDKFFRTKYL